MKMIKKEGGRIPFAYVFAIIFVLMLLLAGIYASILGYHNVSAVNKFYEESDQKLRNIHDMVREKAYHIVMEVIHNVTKRRNPNIYMIQYYAFKDFAKFINNTFPLETQDYKVTVGNYSLKVVMDYKKTKDFVKNYQLTWVSSSIQAVDNQIEGGGYRRNTQLQVYPYVVGFVNYTYHDKRTGYVIKRSMLYNRIIYSPLPLLKFVFDEYNTSTTNLGDFGRLVRYVLTTIAQYRTLEGYAAGAYDGKEIPVTKILTKEDVEKAVNLALMLESVRFFHTYDRSLASSLGIDGILNRFTRDGTIDAADLYFMWNAMDHHFYVGKILGQSIYGYADRFVYAYMRLFWGDLTNQYFADATLKEPIISWNDIKKKGNSWAHEMVHTYLAKWRTWLHIPTSIQGRFASADLSVDFKIITKHAIIPATATMTWIVRNDPVSDTINLILTPSHEYFILHTMGIGTSTPYFHNGNYEYNLVKKSYGEEHMNYANDGPCINVLHYIIDALTRSMKRRSDTWNDLYNKGMIDYAAYEAATKVGSSSAYVMDGNPKNQITIIKDGTDSMINGKLKSAANEFSSMIPERKEIWWKFGAYKQFKDSSDDDAYLYYLTKDTVDMWYQAMKNLYDGGDPSPSDDAGPYDSDCDSFPPSYQVSTWPYGYSGYPFYGRMYNGSFNFHRDLTRDAFNAIIHEMWIMALEKGGVPWYHKDSVWDTVKEQTEDARQKVVGKNGLIEDLNGEFPLSETNEAYSTTQNFGDLRGYLDETTDTGKYVTNFYKYIRWHLGYKILGKVGTPPSDGTNPPAPPTGNGTGNGTGNNTTVSGEGIDVSHWQGNIDWDKVAGAGYKFAFVKATDGTSYVDPEFTRNIQNGNSAGMMMGAYHFAHPERDSASSEASHFVNVIKPYMSEMQLPPALDIEGEASSIGWHSLSNWINEFMSDVQSQLGVTPVLYVNVNYASHLDSSVTKWPLWIADWTKDPHGTPRTGKWSTWSYWQYDDKGSVPGISGSSVDLDVGNGGKLMALHEMFMAEKRSHEPATSRGGSFLIDQLAQWIPESYNVLDKNIYLSSRYSSIPIFPSMYQGRYEFWDTSVAYDTMAQRMKNESIVVKFTTPSISSSVAIGKGHRFVDVQDINYNMGNAPFEYQFNVQLSGSLNMNLRTDRTSLIYGGHHWYTWYNGSVNFNLHIQVPIYTAWFLESHWNKCTHVDNWAFHTDVPFNYTRGYFGVDSKDTNTKPFFISEPLNKLIYDYEPLGEIWNRYSVFYHFSVVNAKDEMAAWNYTDKDILMSATSTTSKALADASSLFSTAASDLQTLISKANGYKSNLTFFYFARDFSASQSKVVENNGYQKYVVDLGKSTVQASYTEGGFNARGIMRSGSIVMNVNEVYDRVHSHLTISPGSISYNKASATNGRYLKMKVEGLQNVVGTDFGFVGTGDVSSLSKYFPKNLGKSLTQEGLIKIFHHLLKDVYVNESINYKFGIYVDLNMGSKHQMYVVWYNGTPTPDSFIVWLNNEVRYIVYKLGISQFPQHGYDTLQSSQVYYTINKLGMDTNYESSSIFGYRATGTFGGSLNGNLVAYKFYIPVPTPYLGHGHP